MDCWGLTRLTNWTFMWTSTFVLHTSLRFAHFCTNSLKGHTIVLLYQKLCLTHSLCFVLSQCGWMKYLMYLYVFARCTSLYKFWLIYSQNTEYVKFWTILSSDSCLLPGNLIKFNMETHMFFHEHLVVMSLKNYFTCFTADVDDAGRWVATIY